MGLNIYNTLSRQKEAFVPWQPGQVSMYICGVTVYASSHIGHAMSALTFDMIRRYLQYRNYQVRHVMSFTDIDDKIIQHARAEQIDWRSLTERYIQQYLAWMDALNVMRATVYPRATEEMGAIVEAIADLIARGYAYELQGDVYYRITRKPEYGELKQQSVDELRAGTRGECKIKCVRDHNKQSVKIEEEGMKGTKREADNNSLLSDERALRDERGGNGTPSRGYILSYVLRPCRRATGNGACRHPDHTVGQARSARVKPISDVVSWLKG